MDVADGGDETEVNGLPTGTAGGLGHDPTDQIVEEQLCIDLFEDSGRRMRTEILNIERVFPFAVDGFDLPTTVIKVHEFPSGVGLCVDQRGEQPTGSESWDLIANQSDRQHDR